MKILKAINAALWIFAVSAAPQALLAQETGVTDRQGAWFAGYTRGNSEEINIELTIIRDVGVAEINFSRWEPVGSARCQFVFDASPEGSMPLSLNGSFGSPENCPQELAIDFSRTSEDGALLRFEGGNFLPEAELRAGLRPLRENDRRARIEGLDILGVPPGITLSEAESILLGQQYMFMPDWTRISQSRSGNWTQETRYYVRDQNGDDENQDLFIIQYSPEVASEENERTVSMLSRNWQIPENQNLTELTLINALTDKYGPTLSFGNDRAWDRSGQNLTELGQRRERCRQGSHQQIPFSINFRGSSFTSNANVYCGPTADIRLQTGRNTGLATVLSVFIVDPDEVWDNFWRTWSVDEYEAMSILYNSVTGATGAAPDL
jgi:hypothetical protein